jgi:hypothetical protein
MNRHEIVLLQEARGDPALTITLPTHRTSPENRQDTVRVKNLVDQAVNQVLEQYNKREVDQLVSQLETLVANIDFRYTLDGLALFVHRGFARAYKLPFTLNERVIVAETFFTRDLVFALNRTPRYWTLALSEKPTRLYEGTRDTLIEIEEEGFPMVHEGPGGEQSLPGGFGVKKSAYRDERHRQFFRKIDSALRVFLLDDPLPLIITGVDRFLSFFNEVSEHKNFIAGTLMGSYDKTSPHDLGKMVWPLAKDYFAQQRQEVLQDLDRAVGERKFASTIGEVWRMANQGRGRLLLVEEDYHYAAKLDASGTHLFPADDPAEEGYIADAVDEVVKIVLDKQGLVVFVENNQLETHQRIALILRF